MNQPPSRITVTPLMTYSDTDAAAIGALLPFLSDAFDGTPVSEDLLRAIITSPYHEQLVARDEQYKIVGTATLTYVMGAGIQRKAWLEDFVVDTSMQGAGVGSALWDAMLRWCQEHNIHQMAFTSNPKRIAAHAFYSKRGAEIYNTSYFKKTI